MSMLLAWVLAASSTLAPGRAHDRLAEAIVTRVEAEAPLFKDDEDRRKTSALLVAIAFRESSLRADAVGDFQGSHPTSFCAFQLHVFASRTREGWNGQDLIDDPDKCVFEAVALDRFPEGEEPQTEWTYLEQDLDKWPMVIAQDISNMVEMQRGYKSQGFKGNLPNPWQERKVTNLHAQLAKYMGTGAPVPIG